MTLSTKMTKSTGRNSSIQLNTDQNQHAKTRQRAFCRTWHPSIESLKRQPLVKSSLMSIGQVWLTGKPQGNKSLLHASKSKRLSGRAILNKGLSPIIVQIFKISSIKTIFTSHYVVTLSYPSSKSKNLLKIETIPKSIWSRTLQAIEKTPEDLIWTQSLIQIFSVYNSSDLEYNNYQRNRLRHLISDSFARPSRQNNKRC